MEITDDNLFDILAGGTGDEGPTYGEGYFEAADVMTEDDHSIPHTFDDILAANFHPSPKQGDKISKDVGDYADDTVKMVEADIAAAQNLLSRVLKDRSSRDRDRRETQPSTATAAAVVHAEPPPAVTVSADRRKEILAQLAAERSIRRGFASEREKVHLEAKELREAQGNSEVPVGKQDVAMAAYGDTGAGFITKAINTAAATTITTTATTTATVPQSNMPTSVSVAAIPEQTAQRPAASSYSIPASSISDRMKTADITTTTAQMSSSLLTAISRDANTSFGASSLGASGLGDKAERDALIARLLAERQAKKSLTGTFTTTSAAAQTFPAHRQSPQKTGLHVSPVVTRRRLPVPAEGSPSATTKPPTPELLKKLRAEAAAKLAVTSHTASKRVPSVIQSKEERVGSLVEQVRGTPRAESIPDSHTSPAKSVSPSGSLPPNWTESGRIFRRKTKEELEQEAMERLESTCTFHPQVHNLPPQAKGAAHGRSTSISRAQRLAELAQNRAKMLQDREQKRVQKEAEELRECTFYPNVAPPSVPEPKPRAASRPKGVLKQGGNFVEPTTARTEAAAPIPAMNKRTHKISAATVNRLYSEAEKRIISRAKAKAEIERKSLVECTFKPTISKASDSMVAGRPEGPPLPSTEAASAIGLASSRGPARKPIYDRVEEIQRAKHMKLAQLRMESELAHPDLTFQPKINLASERIAAARMCDSELSAADVAGSNVRLMGEGETDLLSDTRSSYNRRASSATAGRRGSKVSGVAAATSRLAKDAEDAAIRKALRAEAAARSEASRYTFIPKVSHDAEHLVLQKLAAIGVDEEAARKMTFLERQQLLHEHHEHRKQLAAIELAKAEGCTFTPAIGNADFVLAHARPEMVMENERERVHRLAKQEPEKREAARLAKEKELLAAHSFQPQINANSKSRGRAHTIEEHMRNEEGKRAKLRAAALAEADFRAKHPFQPTLVAEQSRSRSPSTGDGYRLAVASDPEKISERIEELRRAKAAKLDAAKRLREYEELRECTFQPVLNNQRPEVANEVVVVRGLGRFLELRDLSKQIEEEKKAREDAAFAVKGLPPAYDIPGLPRPPTVPEPFHLTAETRRPRPSSPEPVPHHRAGVGAPRAHPVDDRHLSKRQMLANLLDTSAV